jgi:hypothetical protein
MANIRYICTIGPECPIYHDKRCCGGCKQYKQCRKDKKSCDVNEINDIYGNYNSCIYRHDTRKDKEV